MNKLFFRLLNILLLLLLVLIIVNIYPYILNIILFVGSIILPFFLGFVLSYILNPLVNKLEKYLKKRKYAIFLTVAIILIIIILSIKLIYPFLSNEISKLIENLPDIIDTLKNKFNEFSKKFPFLDEKYKPNFDNIISMILKYFSSNLESTKNILSKIFSFVSLFLLTPVIAIYFLIDFENIKKRIKDYLDKKEKYHFKEYLLELHSFSSKYVKTTFIVMIIMIVISTVAFTILKLEYPLFFATIIGITNVIPYIGPYIGGAFPVLYALTTKEVSALAVVITIVIIQAIESNFISPYLHSKRSETHPLFVILSLSFFGSLFGIIGMLFAVPIFKFIEITIKYYPVKLIKK